MKTQKEIYETIYEAKKFEFGLTLSNDKASRKANVYAVSKTWELFNEQGTKSKFYK